MDDTGRDRHEALVRVRPSQKGESEEEYRTGKNNDIKNKIFCPCFSMCVFLSRIFMDYFNTADAVCHYCFNLKNFLQL